MSSVVARAARLLPGRNRPSEALRSEARPPDMAALLSALPVPVILLDPEDRFRHVNHAAEQFLGISAASLAQLRLSDAASVLHLLDAFYDPLIARGVARRPPAPDDSARDDNYVAEAA